MAVGLFGSVLVKGLAGQFGDAAPDAWGSLWFSVVGMLTGLGLTQAIRLSASRIFRREAMGFGDVKFMGAIGAFVGWDGAITTFFLGSVLGAVYGILHQAITKKQQIFFGPFLAAGALISLFWRGEIVRFVTVTWPRWQREAEVQPVVLGGVALVCGALLVIIIRRGRSH